MTNDRLNYAHRRRGVDHNWFVHEPTHLRPKITWPSGKPIALWITVPVEFFPLDTSLDHIRPLGALDRGYPDFWSYSNRDYGLRIGIYRIMRVLDDLGLRATAAINAVVSERHPRIINEIVKRQWEIVANGLDMGSIHHSRLSIEDERALVRKSREILTRASGERITGWHSPGHSESSNTLQLIAEEGFEYVLDWANDDLPYMMNTAAGPLCAMPLTYEWSDRLLLVHHNLTVDEYEKEVLSAFRRLQREAEDHRSGRVFSLSISPWVSGYPHRIRSLESILTKIMNKGSIWVSTGGEIVTTFKSQVALHP